MFLLRIGLLCVFMLSFAAAYPMEAEKKAEQNVELDPADYPDLTNGLSDAEVESTLNGLSLDDLNELNKLLDDAGNGPFDLKASLRGHHRQAKKQHYTDMDSMDEDLESSLKSDKQTLDEGCHDEDDDKDKDECTEKPKCTERPKCNKRPSTRRCTTRKCTTSCKSLDGFLDIHLDGPKSDRNDAKLKCKSVEECDPEDTMCLQRLQHRSKQRPSMNDFSDVNVDRSSNGMGSLERLAAQARRDDALKFSKQLNSWNGKEDSMPDMSNMDYDKLATADTFKDLPKLGNTWAQAKVTEDEVGQLQQNEEQVNVPYERHELARAAHEHEHEHEHEHRQELHQPQEEVKSEEDDKQTEELDENMQLNEPGESAANEGDSFIAQNARDPLRYLIQTQEGYIKSEEEPIDHQLRSDKEHSEMLNYEPYQLSNEHSPLHGQLEQTKRIKRENNGRKYDDDSAELSQETDGLVSP